MASGAMLLSSPVRARGDASLVVLSSSPDLPTLADLAPNCGRNPTLRTGSRAAPIPDDAPRSFTSAASLLRSLGSGHGGQGRGEAADAPRTDIPPTEDPFQSRPSSTHPVSLDPSATTESSHENTTPRQNEDKGLTDLTKTTVAPKKPRRRPKAAKDAREGQTTMPKGRVTKPAGGRNSGGSVNKCETVSKHFQADSQPVELIEIDDTVELEPAVKRRTDWTPIKDTTVAPPSDPAVLQEESSSPHDRLAAGSTGTSFKDLLESYGCRPAEPHATKLPAADVLGKRKQLDLVTTRESKTPEVSPVKAKAPKKKPRTITELATAAYRVSEDQPPETTAGRQPESDSLLKYLGTQDDKPLKTAENGGSKKKAAPRKPAKRSRAAKKTQPEKQSLLSPKSAMKLATGQDFVFGTSSQLATEEDASLLRDLQEAIRVSSGEGLEQTGGESNHLAQRLWDAGARDEDGDLLEPEIIDLCRSPDPPKDLCNPAVIRSLAAEVQPSQTSRAAQDAGVSGDAEDDAEPEPGPCALRGINARIALPSQGTASTNGVSSLPDILGDDEQGPPPSNQELNQLTQSARAGPSSSADKTAETTSTDARPKYDLFTDAQLAREIRGYGFKPVKKRSAMIALLDQCRLSKKNLGEEKRGTRVSVANLSTSAPDEAPARKPATSAPPAAKPRGRPRKNAPSSSAPASNAKKQPETKKQPRTKSGKESATTAAATTAPTTPPRAQTRRKATPRSVIEIADSESEDALSSVASSRAASPERDGDDNGDDADLSLALGPSSQEADVFGFITRAVTTAPRSTDPAKPSWHEKMLMYDPVVLEDLAAWLNAGQLDRAGYDGEVGPGEVKKWCESKSVCCLWKYNLHGGERKRV